MLVWRAGVEAQSIQATREWNWDCLPVCAETVVQRGAEPRAQANSCMVVSPPSVVE
jgi:hypothetical protein